MSSELHVIWIHTIGSSGPGCGHTLVLNVPNLFLPQGLGIICSFFTKHHPQHTHTLILAGKIHSLCYWQYLPKTSDLSMPSPRLRFLILNHLWSWVGTAHYSEEGMEGRPALVLGLTTWGSCLLLRHLSRAEISGQKWGWLQLPLKVHPIATHFLWLSLEGPTASQQYHKLGPSVQTRELKEDIVPSSHNTGPPVCPIITRRKFKVKITTYMYFKKPKAHNQCYLFQKPD